MSDLTTPYPTLRRRDRPKNRRVAVRLSYDGAAFRGLQRQPGQRTVEGALMECLVGLDLPDSLGFASRTDAGVHADGQVAVLRLPDTRPWPAHLDALRAALPGDVRITAAAPAPPKFHPRWSASGKTYLYRLERSVFPAIRAWNTPGVDLARLADAARDLQQAARLDAFTAAGAPAKPAPPLAALTLAHDGARTTLHFEGPAFRRYAIRHMVGALVAEAEGAMPPGFVAGAALMGGPWRGPRAPADGLTLVEVRYPPELQPFGTDETIYY